MRSQVLWDVTFNVLVNIYRRFGRAYRLYRRRLTLPELSEDSPACDSFPTASRPVEYLQLEAAQ
jgi:hypothetical protein